MAGTRYQEGTATGKLPAVITAATPTGTRKVNSCLSGISDGTVWPYRRRPSPRKKSHVSTISCTSPSDSAYGLPISRVTRRARASLLSSTSRPTFLIALPRMGAGTRAHSRCAFRAAPHAVTKSPTSAASTSATTSFSRAGLRDWISDLPPLSEPLLQRLELAEQLAGQALAEPVEVLAHLRELLLPCLDVHLEQLLHRLVGDVEPARIDRPGRGQPADRGTPGPCAVVAAAEDPGEHAAVLAEARPDELVVRILAEPVDAEDARQALPPVALAEREPVAEVVAHVVAAERQHRHRVEAQLAHGPGGRGGLLGGHRGAQEDAVLPVERLGHEGDAGGAAPAEQESVDRHTLGVLPFVRDRGTLRGRSGEARV